MPWREIFDLPERFAGVMPRWATELLVALAMSALALGLRALIDLVATDVIIFALIYPAIVAATLLAGWRAGAVTIVLCQLFAWYYLLPVRNSFAFATPGNAISLALATFAGLLLLWSVAKYRQVAKQAADLQARRLAEAAEARKAEALIQTELRRRDEELRGAKHNLGVLWQASGDGLTLCRAIRNPQGEVVDYRVVEVNDAHARITGVSRDTMLSMPVSEIAPPVNPQWYRTAQNVLDGGPMETFDVFSNISKRWLNIRVSALDGDMFQQTYVDVTERRTLEDQRQTLLKEMSHRVMNNFQMIAGFLHIQGSTAEPAAKALLQSAERRVHVLARLHSLLAYTQSDGEVDAAAYIGELCGQLGQAIDRPDAIRLDWRCEPLVMPADRVVPLGLILSELVTNAVKYAYPPPLAGTIAVTLAPCDGPAWKLTVADDGQGLGDQPGPPAKSKGGLGTLLVQSFLRQIDGEITTLSGAGVRHEIVFRPGAMAPGAPA